MLSIHSQIHENLTFIMENLKGSMHQHVYDLLIPEKREDALVELSRNRETFPELAPILWYSVGTIAAL